MFPLDMLYWFYKNVRDASGNKTNWGTGYGGGYGYGGGRGGGGGGYGGGGFGESTEEEDGPSLNEENHETIEEVFETDFLTKAKNKTGIGSLKNEALLVEFIKREIRGAFAEDFKNKK